jgi:ethanolaminephosphotransferase
MLGHYVSQRGLANLHTYKYSGVDNSLVAKHIMQPFWAKAVNLLPLWMAYVLLLLI